MFQFLCDTSLWLTVIRNASRGCLLGIGCASFASCTSISPQPEPPTYVVLERVEVVSEAGRSDNGPSASPPVQTDSMPSQPDPAQEPGESVGTASDTTAPVEVVGAPGAIDARLCQLVTLRNTTRRQERTVEVALDGSFRVAVDAGENDLLELQASCADQLSSPVALERALSVVSL